MQLSKVIWFPIGLGGQKTDSDISTYHSEFRGEPTLREAVEVTHLCFPTLTQAGRQPSGRRVGPACVTPTPQPRSAEPALVVSTRQFLHDGDFVLADWP